eukprot:c18319_g3_i2 orf=363-1985(+)
MAKVTSMFVMLVALFFLFGSAIGSFPAGAPASRFMKSKSHSQHRWRLGHNTANLSTSRKQRHRHLRQPVDDLLFDEGTNMISTAHSPASRASIGKGTNSRMDEASKNESRIFFPTDEGADPTGTIDSTVALQNTLNKAFGVGSNYSLLGGIVDLGGVEVNLAGGEYIISRPLSMPNTGGGNLVIHGGTIRASESFPSDGYLIQLGSSEAVVDIDGINLVSKSSSNAIYEFISLRDLMLDANFRGGGIQIANSLRTTVDNCYVSHFVSTGILVQAGHETFIHNTFLGQQITEGGDPQERNFSGTAINLSGNDNAVTDVVIFSAAVGIVVNGQANILTGVHCYNKATSFGGVGIHVQLPGNSQTRIIGCYLDFTGIVLDDPAQVTITNTFFLGDANVLIRSTSLHSISGVAIVDNMFSGLGSGISILQLDESQGDFSSIHQTIVDRNSASGMLLKSTRALLTVSGLASNWTLDFSNVLLFPNTIANVQYSFYTNSSTFPQHKLRSVANNQLIVVADEEVFATISAVVDQSDTFLPDSHIYGS